MTPRSLLLLSAAGIVFYDALAAVGSRTVDFPYALASVGSVALYIAIGAATARLRSRNLVSLRERPQGLPTRQLVGGCRG